MFRVLLEHDYDKEMAQEALPHVIKERSTYEKIIKFILDFAEQNQLLQSNIDLLLNRHKYWDIIELFALNAEEISKELSKRLCSNFDAIYLKATVPGTEYTIEHNLRRLCQITCIKPYKNFTLYDFISPIKSESMGKTILLLPHLVELLHLYGLLCDPALAADWKKILSDIRCLEEPALKLINESINIPEVKTPPKSFECKKDRKLETQNIKDLLMDFAKEKGYISCLSPETINTSQHVLEFLLFDIEKDYKAIFSYLQKFIPYTVSYKKKTVYLPKEQQLAKYNVYIDIPCAIKKEPVKKHVMTLYNSLQYELVNYYEEAGLKYVEPALEIRFIYLSIWSALMMHKTHNLHATEFVIHMKRKLSHLMAIRDKIDIYKLKKNYLGTYLPLATAKKISAINARSKNSFYCFEL